MYELKYLSALTHSGHEKTLYLYRRVRAFCPCSQIRGLERARVQNRRDILKDKHFFCKRIIAAGLQLFHFAPSNYCKKKFQRRQFSSVYLYCIELFIRIILITTAVYIRTFLQPIYNKVDLILEKLIGVLTLMNCRGRFLFAT